MIVTFGVGAFEEKSFNFIRGVERVAFFLVQLFRETLERAPNVGAVGSAILVGDLAKHHDFARAEVIGGTPVKSAPIHRKPQIAFPLSRKPSDRWTVKRQIVPA